MNLKRNDLVVVTSGVHAGKQGRVLRVLRDTNQVIVQGVNRKYKHLRRSQKNPQGGRIQKEAPIHISKVLPFDAGAGKGRRVRFEAKTEGARTVFKRRMTTTGAALHTLTRAERAAQ